MAFMAGKRNEDDFQNTQEKNPYKMKREDGAIIPHTAMYLDLYSKLYEAEDSKNKLDQKTLKKALSVPTE